ncbi:DUF2231 domain-containing protein [Sphingobacterium spiritivorum]|uniref:DUF2231 domain-containing protein n=1 Tax=Sphingobacterium spiritivorum TaxID=258 RepID=UPI0021633CD2|nr:DUF2231 domain-containing protein [Sphingobacterium spiritivorum]
MIFIEELLSFTGRWHPVLVHLPIGMLFLAFIIAVFARFERYRYLSSAIPFSLLFGAGAAILTCITGYLLSLDGGYDTSVLSFHQWLGIAVAVLSLWTYTLYRSADTGTGLLAKLVKYRFFLSDNRRSFIGCYRSFWRNTYTWKRIYERCPSFSNQENCGDSGRGRKADTT